MAKLTEDQARQLLSAGELVTTEKYSKQRGYPVLFLVVPTNLCAELGLDVTLHDVISPEEYTAFEQEAERRAALEREGRLRQVNALVDKLGDVEEGEAYMAMPPIRPWEPQEFFHLHDPDDEVGNSPLKPMPRTNFNGFHYEEGKLAIPLGLVQFAAKMSYSAAQGWQRRAGRDSPGGIGGI